MEKNKKIFEKEQPQPLSLCKGHLVHYPTNTPPDSGTRKNNPVKITPFSAVFAIKIGKYIIRYFKREIKPLKR